MTTPSNPYAELIDRLHPLSGPLIDLRAVIHPLTQQGEDRIWREAEKACKILDRAETERIETRAAISQLTRDVEELRAERDALLQRPIDLAKMDSIDDDTDTAAKMIAYYWWRQAEEARITLTRLAGGEK